MFRVLISSAHCPGALSWGGLLDRCPLHRVRLGPSASRSSRLGLRDSVVGSAVCVAGGFWPCRPPSPLPWLTSLQVWPSVSWVGEGTPPSEGCCWRN